jgi:hypothetical protein
MSQKVDLLMATVERSSGRTIYLVLYAQSDIGAFWLRLQEADVNQLSLTAEELWLSKFDG